MAIIKCPECGHQVSDQAKTCPSCGIEIAGKITKCPECGDVVFNDSDECPNCHHPLNIPEVKPQPVTPRPEVTAEQETSPAKGGMKRTYVVLIVSFVVALLAVFVSLYFYKTTQDKNEMDAYENAMASSEPAVLQNFLDVYTEAPQEHRDSIAAHLEQLRKVDTEWGNAVRSGSKTALERYIQLHPGSIHVTEARLKIDSLDWLAATAADTPEAYQAYIDGHLDNGLHLDEARIMFEKSDARRVTDDDRQMISSLFGNYFTALANNEEASLTETLSGVLGSFLHKENATKTDVMTYMKKLHAPDDITGMTFSLNNDWKIEKTDAGDGRYKYTVTFSVDHRITRNDTSKETFSTYNVVAGVSPEHKISDLNMKKIVP
ncbi:MAG: zinc ribbon domain-containing protein [Prevotella sp.]|nr:zinc ribbon domain-containing protein [Prevotella sp.]